MDADLEARIRDEAIEVRSCRDPATLRELSHVVSSSRGSLDRAASALFGLATDPFRHVDTDSVAAALMLVLDTSQRVRCCRTAELAAAAESRCWRCFPGTERPASPRPCCPGSSHATEK